MIWYVGSDLSLLALPGGLPDHAYPSVIWGRLEGEQVPRKFYRLTWATVPRLRAAVAGMGKTQATGTQVAAARRNLAAVEAACREAFGPEPSSPGRLEPLGRPPIDDETFLGGWLHFQSTSGAALGNGPLVEALPRASSAAPVPHSPEKQTP